MKLLKIVLIIMLVLAASAFAAFHFFFKLPVPEYSGSIQIAGLTGRVTVKTDQYGIPHVFAENEKDLFFAQGYITARERLFQMDMTRMAGRGELSSIFGERTIDKDRFLKTVGFYRQSKKNYQILSEKSKGILKAYADGVNAYIKTCKHLPREYVFLGAKPEPWVPEDSMVITMLMSYSLTRSKKVDLILNKIREQKGDEIIKSISPSFPDFAPTLTMNRKPVTSKAFKTPGGINTSVTKALVEDDDVFPFLFDIAASNWMIFSPQLTSTGKALFAGSPDLSPTLPAMFYIIHLKAGEIDIIGGAIPGVPGLGPLGFNGTFAWSAVNGRGDELDYFKEKINPENPNQYLTENGYKDFELIEEILKIKGEDGIRDEKLTVRISRHGPIISSVMPNAPENCAMQWTALELPGRDIDGLVGLLGAKNFEEFRTGLSLVRTMNLNIGYADINGNIGWQFTAGPPIRKKGNGSLPVPGWTGEYDWQGFIPFEDLPYDYNPKKGYAASFNNDPGNVDYYLTNYYLFERAIRFEQIMAGRGDKPVDFSQLKEMQLDRISVVAQRWVPLILNACKSDNNLKPYTTLLENWDFSIDMQSSAATIFNYFYYLMMKNTLMDEVGEEMWENGLGNEYLYYIPDLALTKIIKDNKNSLYDDKTTTETQESRDDIILKSMDQTIEFLSDTFGEDTEKWKWGMVHKMSFNHPLGEKLFFLNLDPVATHGSHHTINSGFWTPKRPLEMTSGGVIRIMVDFADIEKSTIISPPGQSGHFKSPYYDDMAETWAKGDQVPMRYKSAHDLDQTLILTPASGN